MKVRMKVVIWQEMEVDERQAKGIMDGELSTYDLDGNVTHLFEEERQLKPSENTALMAILGETGDNSTIEVLDDDGEIVWSNKNH